MRNTLGFMPHTIFSIAAHHKWALRGRVLPVRGLFLTGGGVGSDGTMVGQVDPITHNEWQPSTIEKCNILVA